VKRNGRKILKKQRSCSEEEGGTAAMRDSPCPIGRLMFFYALSVFNRKKRR